ncbi:hypothetical protein AVEN_164012-1 [Araneus ventricosus]|uniref:Uncharacterized protein n=1 Tax=Araneus ventricosus TaxID=182803 RepID=A0A4Y2D8G1_ARAVE|nr:hypothetical protein AVEN_164012-1 [Araneus ventricosus]
MLHSPFFEHLYVGPGFKTYNLYSLTPYGRGGLAVRSRRAEGFQVRNPIPLKIRRVLGLLYAKSYVKGGAKCPPLGVMRKFGEGVPAHVSSYNLTELQNYEVRPKIALVLLQNGKLI